MMPMKNLENEADTGACPLLIIFVGAKQTLKLRCLRVQFKSVKLRLAFIKVNKKVRKKKRKENTLSTEKASKKTIKRKESF